MSGSGGDTESNNGREVDRVWILELVDRVRSQLDMKVGR